MKHNLSKREEEVWGLIAMGKTTKEIAKELKISVSTANTYIRRLYKKLGVTNRSEASFLFGQVKWWEYFVKRNSDFWESEEVKK